MLRQLTLIAVCVFILGPSADELWGRDDKAPVPERVDRFGDPLPPGVLARMGSVWLNCEDSVRSAVFLPDGKTLTVVADTRSKQLWFFDVASGKTLRRMSLPEGPRQHALTPDGRLLVVRTFHQKSLNPNSAGATSFAEIHVLDAATGTTVWKTDPRHELCSMALSADGKLLVGGMESSPGRASDIFVWDTATGKERLVLRGHLTPVQTLAFSADGKKLLSAAPDATPIAKDTPVKGSVRVWSLPDGKLVKQMPARGREYVFSPDGRALVFQEREPWKLRLWDLERDREIAELPVAYSGYLFSPDGRHVVTGGAEMLRVWDATTGRAARTFHGVVASGTSPLAFSADGKILASYSGSWQDHAIRFWDVAKGTELRPFGGHVGEVARLAFSGDGKKLISGGIDHTARVWETATGKELAVHDAHQAPVTALAFAADGRLVASGDRGNVTHIWGASTGKLLHRLASGLKAPEGTLPAICALSFTADGKALWVGSRVRTYRGLIVAEDKGELALYDTATGKRIRAITADSSPLAVSLDGALSVWAEHVEPKEKGGYWQQKVSVRRMEDGREQFVIASDRDRAMEMVDQAIFSPDGRLLALHSHWLAESFTRSAMIPSYRLVEVASGREIVNEFDADYPWTLFTSSGQVVAGSYRTYLPIAPVVGPVREDRPSLRVVDVVTKRAVGELPSHPRAGGAWAVAPGSTFFAHVNTDQTILVWDLPRQGLKQPPVRKGITRDGLEALWADLQGENARQAFHAAGYLVAVPTQSVPFLRERLKPVAAPSPTSIAGTIKDLDSKQYEAREKARVALERMEELAEPALRQALQGNPSLEMRRRLEQLVDRLDEVWRSPERVRTARAVAILERAGTPEAREHLATLAAGAPAAWLTREARASLERLDRNTPGHK